MFKKFKKITAKLKIKKNKLRGSDDLFSNGEIFQAKNKELDNILKGLSTGYVANDLIERREIIRAITVLTIKNNRHAGKIQTFNIVLSILLVCLTIYTLRITLTQLKLTAKQTYYTEVSTRSDRIGQARKIQDAIRHCEKNPESTESGLYNTTSGKQAPCAEVLEKYKN